jgi:ABC-2 type transport system permease protein
LTGLAMLTKHELINYFRNPAVLVVVLLPVLMSKIMITVMDMADAQMLMLATWVLFAQIMIGIMLVGPTLIEERESRTIDALLCSPLNYAQVIVGKTLPVVVLTLLSQVVVLLINGGLQDFQPLLVVPMLLGALIFIEVGVVIGMLVGSSSNGSAVSAVVFICLFLVTSFYQVLPGWAYDLVVLLPSISIVEMINAVFDDGTIPLEELAVSCIWLAALSMYIFGYATQRSYRKG